MKKLLTVAMFCLFVMIPWLSQAAEETGQSLPQEEGATCSTDKNVDMLLEEADGLPTEQGLSENEFNFLIGADMAGGEDLALFEHVHKNVLAARKKAKVKSWVAQSPPTDYEVARSYQHMLEAARQQELTGKCGEACIFGAPTAAGNGPVAKYLAQEIKALGKSARDLKLAAKKRVEEKTREARTQASAQKAKPVFDDRFNENLLAGVLPASAESSARCQEKFLHATKQVASRVRRGDKYVWPVAHQFRCLEKYELVQTAASILATAMEEEESGQCNAHGCVVGRVKHAGQGPVYRYLRAEINSLNVMNGRIARADATSAIKLIARVEPPTRQKETCLADSETLRDNVLAVVERRELARTRTPLHYPPICRANAGCYGKNFPFIRPY